MEETRLDDLNVGLYLHAPENMINGGWEVALYIDDRADEKQTEALTKIYGGQAGGHPAVLASLIGEIMGVHSAKVNISYTDKEKKLAIEGIADVETHSLEGMDGKQVTVNNPPLCIAPGHPAIVHETKTFSYKDKEEHSHSGTVGLASGFSYQP